MVAFVELFITSMVGIIILIKLWPIITGKSAGSNSAIKTKIKLAEAREKLSEEELITELTEINKQIDKKKKEREDAAN